MSHDPTPVDFLAVLDLETLPLDFLARARGYERYPRRPPYIRIPPRRPERMPKDDSIDQRKREAREE